MDPSLTAFQPSAAVTSSASTVWRKRLLFEDTIRTLSLALDFDDGQKLLHGWRTAYLSLRLARYMGRPNPGLICYAALLHDTTLARYERCGGG